MLGLRRRLSSSSVSTPPPSSSTSGAVFVIALALTLAGLLVPGHQAAAAAAAAAAAGAEAATAAVPARRAAFIHSGPGTMRPNWRIRRPMSPSGATGSGASPQKQQQEQEQRTQPPTPPSSSSSSGRRSREDLALPSAHDAVASFAARPFDPKPWLRNEHFQTIWGARALQDMVQQAVAPSTLPQGWQDVYDRRERWETPDGDFFHVDFMYAAPREKQSSSSSSEQQPPAKPPRPVAIVLHGLESTSSALLPRSMAKAYAARGFDVLALNFRGCCGHENHRPYSYHLGFTDDLAHVIRRLHTEDPRRRVYLSGFSLGGNVILKCLGELGPEAPALGVEGAAVACVPFDAVRSSSKIDSGFNRLVYAANFLSTLKVKARRKWEQFQGRGGVPYDLERVLACTRIGDFDDEVIAKLHDFEDKVDYYRQSCSKQYLPRIRVPTLVVNAVDDPFINEQGLPSVRDVGAEAPVLLVYHAHGGHCGFLTGDEKPGMAEEDRWLPTELARFLAHVDAPFRALFGQQASSAAAAEAGGGGGEEREGPPVPSVAT